jgi:putative ABC transport system permease protein
MPYLRDSRINVPVLGFLCGVTVLTAIIFGLAPGLTIARGSVNEALKDETRGGTSTAQARRRRTLVVAEISVALVLLVGAGLMLKSVRALLSHDPGFDAHNVLTFSVNLPTQSYPVDKDDPDFNTAALHFDNEYTDRLRAIPVSGGGGTVRFVVQRREAQLGREDEAQIVTVAER